MNGYAAGVRGKLSVIQVLQGLSDPGKEVSAFLGAGLRFAFRWHFLFFYFLKDLLPDFWLFENRNRISEVDQINAAFGLLFAMTFRAVLANQRTNFGVERIGGWHQRGCQR